VVSRKQRQLTTAGLAQSAVSEQNLVTLLFTVLSIGVLCLASVFVVMPSVGSALCDHARDG
jgi:hypothetical protein